MTDNQKQEGLRTILNKISFTPEFAQTHGGCPPAYKGGKLTGLNETEQAIRNYMADEMLKLVGDIDEKPVTQQISDLEHAVINGQNVLRHELYQKINEWRNQK